MNLREALITQSPSLALQRAAADEIARLDTQIAELIERVQLMHELAESAERMARGNHA